MSFWRNLSRTYKIFITMLLFILTIQISTLLYIWLFKSAILLKKERTNLEYQLERNGKRLMNYVENLQKEIHFLAQLELMDDILANDVDKRIGILLEKKAHDLGKNIILVAHRDNKQVVTSTQKDYAAKEYLHFSSPIYASFQPKKLLGSLTLLYPYINLQNLKVDNPYQTLWLNSPLSKENIGILNHQESITVSMKLDGRLSNWVLSLAHEKEDALQSIQEIKRILLWGFLFSLGLLLSVVWILSKKQIELLEHTQKVLSLKRRFLSTMSHELRTPLGSILNLTQHLMVSPNMNDNHIDMLKRIENSSEHLLNMINNLLQLSKLDSKSMSVQKTSIDILSVIEEIVEMVEPLIIAKELEFYTTLPKHPIIIETDVHHFKQIVMNLLSNAIKYTHKGSIALILEERKHQLLLRIKDTGIGIALDKQDSLFSEFYQAHMKKFEIQHSTGLGLALSQKVAKLINGKITIKSAGLHKGCEAIFSFSSL